MKKALFKRIAVFAGVCITAGMALAQDAAKAAPSAKENGAARSGRPLKVLMIGNSFTGSVMRETPNLA